jgi:cytochrome c55X
MGAGALNSRTRRKAVMQPGAWRGLPFWLALGLLLFSAGIVCAAPLAPDAVRRTELIKMVRNDCGSCHGMQLTGGLGLPLTPDALRQKPDSGLTATILYGRPGTAMPPWQPFLSAAEAEWIVENLKQGFPNVDPH